MPAILTRQAAQHQLGPRNPQPNAQDPLRAGGPPAAGWGATRWLRRLCGIIPIVIILAERLLPEALWERVQPLLPPPPSHARGGAPRTVPDRACVAAILFLCGTSTPWALLP